MSDKGRLLREGDEAFAELHRAFDGLADEQARQVWLGTWGVREILVHIAGWHRAMVPAFQRLARGEPPYPEGMYDDFDAWNARFVAERDGVKTADVVAELDASYGALVAAVALVPEAQFAEGGTARGLFDGVGPGHYREHAAQIREWRAGTR